MRALVPLGYRGMAITVPYKVAVLPLLDAVDDDVRAIGAANYLAIEAGRLIGHNNDGKGVVKAIEKLAPLAGRRVVMLGAGGTGRAMAVEMAWAGAAHLTLITRRQEQGQEVADTVTRASGVPAVWQPWQGEVTVPAGTTLLMNATHLGCAPELEPVPVRWDTVDSACVVVDVITNPRITPFLATARQHGCPVVDGVEMLVQLAMQIFEQWTGVTPRRRCSSAPWPRPWGSEPGALTLAVVVSDIPMNRVVPAAALLALGLLDGCGRPDGRALQTIACQQVASTIDLQSVGQIDALRKALGLAPGVDPIGTCRELGVTMDPGAPGAGGAGGEAGDREEQRSE